MFQAWSVPIAVRATVLPSAHMAKRRGPLKNDPVVEATFQWQAHGYPGGARLQASLSLLRAEAIVRQRNAELLRPFGVSFAHHEVLMLLFFSKAGALPLGKIGERLMVHPTSVSNAVDALVALGFVERVEHPLDRRARLARITRRGRNVAKRSAVCLCEAQFGLEALTEAESTTLFQILLKLRAAANDFEQSGPQPSGDVPTGHDPTERRSARR
ncbi:MAG: transcriptional regulator, MarR family [Ilumatobacteraceae bacterium]|nr:transcriptional regulator, MarR family [Ilumatobacteraceae bacterium]